MGDREGIDCRLSDEERYKKDQKDYHCKRNEIESKKERHREL